MFIYIIIFVNFEIDTLLCYRHALSRMLLLVISFFGSVLQRVIDSFPFCPEQYANKLLEQCYTASYPVCCNQSVIGSEQYHMNLQVFRAQKRGIIAQEGCRYFSYQRALSQTVIAHNRVAECHIYIYLTAVAM